MRLIISQEIKSEDGCSYLQLLILVGCVWFVEWSSPSSSLFSFFYLVCGNKLIISITMSNETIIIKLRNKLRCITSSRMSWFPKPKTLLVISELMIGNIPLDRKTVCSDESLRPFWFSQKENKNIDSPIISSAKKRFSNNHQV